MKKRRERSKAKGKREYIGRPAPGVTVMFIPSDIGPEIMDSVKAAGRSVKGVAVGLKDGLLGAGKGIAEGYQRASAAQDSST